MDIREKQSPGDLMKKFLLILLLAGCAAPNKQPDDSHQWEKLMFLQGKMEQLDHKVEANLSHFEMRINVLDRDLGQILNRLESED